MGLNERNKENWGKRLFAVTSIIIVLFLVWNRFDLNSGQGETPSGEGEESEEMVGSGSSSEQINDIEIYTVTKDQLLEQGYIYRDEQSIVFPQYKGVLYSFEEVQYKYVKTCMYVMDDSIGFTAFKYCLNTK